MQLLLELADRPFKRPEAHQGQAPAGQDRVGLLSQLLAAGEIAAIAHINVGQEAVGRLAGQAAQLLQPNGRRR